MDTLRKYMEDAGHVYEFETGMPKIKLETVQKKNKHTGDNFVIQGDVKGGRCPDV